MIDHDSNFHGKQVQEILQHICRQKIDLEHLTHPFIILEDTAELIVAWDYFKSLSVKERFYQLYQSLNESNFKSTCLSLLNAIKSSSYGVTNGTFICLRSHLQNLLNSSQRILNDPQKSEKGKENLKYFEFDESTRWNPQRSEWLLNNISIRSALASKFLQTSVQQSMQLWNNIFLVGSSVLILDVEVLQREVELVLDQFRCMQIKLTSANEVEESIRQIHEGSEIIPQAFMGPGKYTFISTFTLASFIATHIQSSIVTFYRRNISEIAVNPAKNGGKVRGPSTTPDPTADYLLSFLSIDDPLCSSSMQLTSSYVLSKWKEFNPVEKLRFLSQLGFIRSDHNVKQKTKGRREYGDLQSLEYIQQEFSQWYSDLPHIQERRPLIADRSFDALESGDLYQDNRSDNTQDMFLQWCNSHPTLGAELCEFLSYCPMIKLSSPGGVDGVNWCTWAAKAFTELQLMYNLHIGDNNLLALFSKEGPSKNSKKSKNKKQAKEQVEVPAKNTDAIKKKGKKLKNQREQIPTKDTRENFSGTKGLEIFEDKICGVSDENSKYLELNQFAPSTTQSSNAELLSVIESHDINNAERTTFDSTSQRESDCFSLASSKASDEETTQPPQDILNSPLREDNSKVTEMTADTTLIPPKDDCSLEPLKSPSIKKHSGDFLGSECHIFSKNSKRKTCENSEKHQSAELQRNSTGSHSSSSRIDLIQWDHQRRLAEVLTEDILDMASNLYKIAQLRRPWQSAAIERVRVAVQSIWPQAQCDIFGSFGTGLAIPSSDVDIVVTGVINQLQWWGGKAVTPLAILSQHLQLQDWVSTVRAIEHTLMPVIKITTAPVPMPSLGADARKDYRGVIKIDISISSSGSPFGDTGTLHTSFGPLDSAPYASPSPQPYFHQHNNSYSSPSNPNFSSNSVYHYSPQSQTFANFTPMNITVPSSGVNHQGVSTRDFVLRLCAMNPSIIPLVLVMKQFLQEKGLHDPFTGGLSSYAVTIMMASILQPYALERPELHPDLGTLFLSFLKRYGTDFDTRKHAIVLSINGPFVPLTPGAAFAHVPRVGTPNYWKPAEPVIVTDPLNSQNNLGRSCFGFRQIQTEFDNALDRALQCLEDGTLSISLDHPSDVSNNTLGKIFNSTRKNKSVLGAIFGTQHHDSVVKLQAQIWCPLEVWSPNNTTNEAKSNGGEVQRPPSLKCDSLSLRLIRKECEEILATIPDSQLEEVKTLLQSMKQKEPM